MDTYLEVTAQLYRNAAIKPDVGLCFTTTPMNALPDLVLPKIMQEMNYGCGSIVAPRDLMNNPKILYVVIGGGVRTNLSGIDRRIVQTAQSITIQARHSLGI